MKLLKLFVLVVAVSMTTTLFSQKFGVKAGLNFANMLAKDDDDTYSEDYKMNLGYQAGVTAEFPITEMFSFETGLLLSTKGYKISEEETVGGVKMKIEGSQNLMYLDVPLTAKASYNIGGAKIYGLFGPYIGLGLSGKVKSEVTIDGDSESDEEDIKFGSDEDEDNLKSLDFGLTIGAGVEINAIQVGLSYGLGLANLSHYTDNGAKINNRVLGITVGYRFGAK